MRAGQNPITRAHAVTFFTRNLYSTEPVALVVRLHIAYLALFSEDGTSTRKEALCCSKLFVFVSNP